MNHNFPDLNNIMWDAQELAMGKRTVSNHYIPMPEYYTSTEALVRNCHPCLTMEARFSHRIKKKNYLKKVKIARYKKKKTTIVR